MKPAAPVTRYRMRLTDLRRLVELNEPRDDLNHQCTSQARRSGGKASPPDVAGQPHVFRGEREFVWRSRSEEHTSELQSRFDLVCRLLLEKKKKNKI